MGLMISAFEALTLLPPNQERFRCYHNVGRNVYRKATQNLETLSNLAIKHYEADVGYREMGKRKELGFRLGFYWFPVTKARVNRMLNKYGYEIAD